MVKLPLHELELLKRWRNHAEFTRTLKEIGLLSDLPFHQTCIHAVASAWFILGREHLREARQVLTAGASRAAYSRAYYAGYSFSKSVRFMVHGFVSLKGDDHQAVGQLPDDFPESGKWGSLLESLYQDRLRADYDNWTDTAAKYTLTPGDCVKHAEDFQVVASKYLSDKFGVTL